MLRLHGRRCAVQTEATQVTFRQVHAASAVQVWRDVSDPHEEQADCSVNLLKLGTDANIDRDRQTDRQREDRPHPDADRVQGLASTQDHQRAVQAAQEPANKTIDYLSL